MPFDYIFTFVDSYDGTNLDIFKIYSDSSEKIRICTVVGQDAARVYRLLAAFYSLQDRNAFIQEHFDKGN
jgi:hypothetical protein